ncbi:hypothetical protein EI555_019062, partial [Monodon monoceros]
NPYKEKSYKSDKGGKDFSCHRKSSHHHYKEKESLYSHKSKKACWRDTVRLKKEGTPHSNSKSHLTEHENIHTGKSLLSIINVEMSLPRGNASLRIKTFILERNSLNVMNVGNLQTKGKTSVFIKSMQERNLINVVSMRKVIFRSQALLDASGVLLEIKPMHGRKMPYKYSKCAKPFTQKPCFIKYYNIRIDETHYECIKGGKASGIPLLIVCEEPIQ